MIGDKQLARLVKFFTEAPSSRYTPEDISITFGEARIKYEPVFEDHDATGFIDRAVYGKPMLDAAISQALATKRGARSALYRAKNESGGAIQSDLRAFKRPFFISANTSA